MADCVTIGASAAVRTVRDVDQGIYEYLEEQHPILHSPERTLALPVRLSGWLWRREGFGIFHRYRRRFCVFKAQQAALFIFSDDDTVNGKLLRRLVLTRVTLTSRTDRSFVAQGFLQDKELHKDASESLARRASSFQRGLLPGDSHKFYKLEEERLKAVSAKSCSVWTHCFKYHVKSYTLRQQDVEEEEDPDFVFEDATKSQRCHSLPGSSFRSASGLFSASRTTRRETVVRKRESDAPPSTLPIQFDQELALTATKGEESVDLELSHSRELEEVEPSDLPSFAAIWEDEELLSHCIDYDTITKEEKLAAGASGEVWRAMHRSQEVVVKNLRREVKTESPSKSGEVNYRRRREVIDFVEEIRIMSRLEHNRIVEFRGVALSSKQDLLLVMEYLPRGDLRTYLNTVKRKGDNCSRDQFQSIWTWTKLQWRLAIDIIEGLVYLHSLNPPLVHGDLKSANVLLRANLRAKLTDFGLSRYLQSAEGGNYSEDKAASLKEVTDEDKKDSTQYGSRACGTGRWMAPELFVSGSEVSMASDVYAFGIVLSEIDTCELPFYEREKAEMRSFPPRAGEGSSEDGDLRLMNESVLVHRIIADGWKPSFRVTCPEVIKKLAHDCLLPDPSARPTSLAVAHRLRKAATKRERPEALAAQAKATTSLLIR